MDNNLKRSDHHYILKIVVFGVLTLASVASFVFGMINNGNGAVQRFNALTAADKAGGDVDSALNELRNYIYSHMNTEIGGGPTGIYPPIQLNGTYERLLQAEEKRVNDINDNLIVEAKDFCEKNGPAGFSGRNRIECVNNYVDKNGAKLRPIDDSFYKYDFVSPRWSPDLAGFSLLASFMFGCLAIFYLLMYRHTKHLVEIAN